MSIEYTLDIQLTEMGFPDLVQPQEAFAAETPQNSLPSNSNSNNNNNSFQNCSSQKLVPDKRILSLKSKQLSEENKAQSSEKKEETRSTKDLPRNSGTEAKNALRAQSKKTNKAGVTTQNCSDDSDVSYMEDEIDDEDDFCEEEEEEENEEEGGNFPCSVCSLQCSSMFKLQDHMNLHTGARPYYCAECGKRFSQIRNYRTHLKSHARAKTRQPKCRICLRRFANETDLKYHLTMNHFEDQFFECDRCKRVFTCIETCQQHIEFSCLRKFMCDDCGRNFPNEKVFKRHRESNKCYSRLKCAECPQIFARKNDLLKHSFSHLGLLPYTCVRCRCHFRLARLYLKHQCKPQSIHCVACLREFLNDHEFKQHKKDTGCWGIKDSKGDEIRCLECGQRFDNKEDLKKHGGAHQRVLKCAECGKGFRSALLLMSHMGGHAGQSPCLCQSCGLGFPHQQNYDIHLKTCGQTPQPAKPSKKHKSSKRSEQKRTNSKPTPLDSSTSSSIPGTDVTTPSSSSSNSTASLSVSEVKTGAPEHRTPDKSTSDPGQRSSKPSSSSASPNLGTAAQDNSPQKANQDTQDEPKDPTDGCWKLSLDKPPPPGVNLLLFLPVNQNQNSNMILPCAAPQVLSVPDLQVQASPPSNGLQKCKQDMDPLPLDLSQKISNECFPNTGTVSSIKSEAEEMEVCAVIKREEKDSTVQAHHNNIPSLEQNKLVDNSVDSGLQSSTSPLFTDGVAPKKIKIEPEDDL